MANTSSPQGDSGHLLTLSDRLSRAETVEDAASRSIELAETVFDYPVVSVCEYDQQSHTTTAIASSAPDSIRTTTVPERIPTAVAQVQQGHTNGSDADDTPEAIPITDPRGSIQAEAVVPVGENRVLCLGVTEPDGFDETQRSALEGIAANLETVLDRIDRNQSVPVDCDLAGALFEESGEPTFVTDSDGTLAAINRGAVELTGRERDGLLGEELSDILTTAGSVPAHLETAVTGASEPLTATIQRPEDPAQADATALRRLNEITVDSGDFERTIERLLSLGCDRFGLETGILSRVDGDDYEVEAVVDATGTHEAGAVYDLGQTMCQATLASDATESLAFADVADTDYQSHPAAQDVRAYIAAPVTVDSETYGTVNFWMERPCSAPFRREDEEFVKLIAKWIGTEIERRRRFEELERYETILEAVDDPVYALDDDGRFTFVNEAAKREFGYGSEVLGKRPSVGMNEVDVARVREQIEGLLATDERSTTAEFELDTVTGDSKVVENRLALIGDDEFRGTAGVLRDITARKEQRRQLESFRRAIEEAADGIAILDGDEYVYIDQSHVDMYGFETREQLLGKTWRELYDDAEVERLEREAFPALESEGHWRGMLTGSRPDGSTFPVELSLTIVDDGRLVCTVRDETERQARQRELQLKERAMDEANLGITISDPEQEDNPLIYANDGFVEQTGYSRADAIGWNCRFLQGEETNPERVATLREAIDNEEPTTIQLRNYRKDGEMFWNRLSVTPVYDEQGGLTNYIGIQQDVSKEVRKEQELFEEREQFRLLVESVDEYAFLVVDEDGTVQTWNRSAEAMFGYDAKAAVGMSTAQLHPESVRETGLTERLLQQARVAGESAHEGWRVRADGSQFYADVRYAPLEGDDSEFRGYVKIVRDMTDRRRERRRTERFVEESDDVVTIVDTDGIVTYASGSADRVLGYDPDDLVGENLFDYLHPDGRKHAMETFFRCVEDSEKVKAECRLMSPDDEWIDVEGRCRNMLDDDAIEGVLVYLRDVTESKENARRFESIFNQTFQFTGLLEPDGTVIEANDAALEFGGVERDDIVGTPFFEAPWWTHSEDVYDKVRSSIDRAANGKFIRYEAEVRGADGFATIDFSVKPVTDQDGDVSLLVVEGRDITAQQQHRQHLEVMQRVMRHNMRNDLTKMRGWTQMMCEEEDTEKRAEQFDTVDGILDKWEAMTEKMKEIRQIIKSQGGQWGSMESERLVRKAVASVREDYADATIVADASDTESTELPTTILEAVRELVENGIKASDDPTLEVELTRPADAWVEITVRDDGPGMPDTEAKVLETGEETPLNHGQGLGLWMVRMIVTQSGGDVSVESSDDGTAVCLRLPT